MTCYLQGERYDDFMKKKKKTCPRCNNEMIEWCIPNGDSDLDVVGFYCEKCEHKVLLNDLEVN